jgi:hypothetical protein
MGVDLSGQAATGAVAAFRRHVLYVPGYDPFPPRRYRELYRTEGAEQAAISGYQLGVGARRGETYGWHVTSLMERPAQTEIEVLVWSDLVKASMGRGVAGTYWLLLRSIWVFGVSGALWQLGRLRKGPLIAALYPAVLLVLQALVALGVGWLVLWLRTSWVSCGASALTRASRASRCRAAIRTKPVSPCASTRVSTRNSAT